MFTASRNRAFAVLLAAATALLSAGERAQAQYPIRQRWLVALQQQNALQQQQNAVQAAVQQTTVLLQNAYQRVELPQPLAVTSLIDFQQQQSALQIALLQTSVLLQASYGRNPTLSETALREQNTLQTALAADGRLAGRIAGAERPTDRHSVANRVAGTDESYGAADGSACSVTAANVEAGVVLALPSAFEPTCGERRTDWQSVLRSRCLQGAFGPTCGRPRLSGYASPARQEILARRVILSAAKNLGGGAGAG